MLEEDASEIVDTLTVSRNMLKKKCNEHQEILENIRKSKSVKKNLIFKIDALEQLQQQILQSKDQITTLIKTTEEQFSMKMENLQTKYSKLEMSHENLKTENAITLENLNNCKEQIESNDSEISELSKSLEKYSNKLNKESEKEKEKSKNIGDLQQRIISCKNKIEDLELQSVQEEKLRRKLHNEIVELKGNIRVFVRVRPLLGNEKNQMLPYEFVDESKLQILPVKLKCRKGTEEIKSATYGYDKVFSPEASQAIVFEEISALVQSALDGYNVCIFTYGQTGSGKTFTMEGPSNPNEETQGMIPRAVHQIFNYANTLKDKGWEYDLTANYLEIYNEKIRDLLTPASKLSTGSLNSDVHKVQHTDAEQSTTVSNITYVPVGSGSEVHDLLQKAGKNRAVARTECNERSSRSHSVFQLRMKGKNSITGEEATGLLNLVDLAGSERLKDSKATGDRLRETKNINSSLSTLGKVITALSNKERSIPYRESQLTWLLKYSLGGNSKTLMFVNISPALENVKESTNSLRFAKEVNSCTIGPAKKVTSKATR